MKWVGKIILALVLTAVAVGVIFAVSWAAASLVIFGMHHAHTGDPVADLMAGYGVLGVVILALIILAAVCGDKLPEPPKQ